MIKGQAEAKIQLVISDFGGAYFKENDTIQYGNISTRFYRYESLLENLLWKK